MPSAARAKANYANAQKSTGPKTAAGKAKSAQNATTHGFATGILHIPESEHDAFCQFEANLKETVRPKGALERQTCDQLTLAAWRLRCLHTLVQKLYRDHQGDPLVIPAAAAQLRQLTRYRAAFEMTFFRSLKQLRELQTRRAGRDLQLHQPERIVHPPQLNPNLYSAANHTRGDRELLLMGAGFMGPRATLKVTLSKDFHPAPVFESVPPPGYRNRE